MADYADPFSLFYASCWEQIKKQTALVKLFPAGTMVEYTLAKKAEYWYNPTRVTTGVTGKPQLILVVDSSDHALEADNISNKTVMSFSWSILTPEYLYNPGLFPGLWELLKALKIIKPELLKLQWENKTYVFNISTALGDFNSPQYIYNNSAGTTAPVVAAWRTSITMDVTFQFDRVIS